jgi:hypothetical protein
MMFWSGEGEWFTFSFVGFDPKSGKHQVGTRGCAGRVGTSSSCTA